MKYNNYFPAQFLQGLQTKSESFQNKFFEIADDICVYFDTEEERRDFQNYIAENHTFCNPGNILFSNKLHIGRRSMDFEKIKDKIHSYVLGLFDDTASDLNAVPHVIVCVSAPNGCFFDEDVTVIENMIAMEQMLNGIEPAGVTTIFNDTENGRGISCFVAGLK